MVVHIAIHRQIKKCNKINNLQIPPPSDHTGVGVERARPSLTEIFFCSRLLFTEFSI